MDQRTHSPPLLSDGNTRLTVRQDQATASIGITGSIHQKSLSDYHSNRTFPFRLSLKSISPQAWQQLFNNEKRHEPRRRDPRRDDDTLGKDGIPVEQSPRFSDESGQLSLLPPAVQTHIDQFYEQIDDLTSQLSVEQFNHRKLRARAEETHSLQLADQHQHCKVLLQQQQLDHQKQHDEQEATYLQRFHDEQLRYLQREEQLQDELAFVKGSFHAYKMSLQTGDAERHPRQAAQKADAPEERMPVTEEIHGSKRDVSSKERAKLEARHSVEIENLRRQHQAELDGIHKVFADSVFDRVKQEGLRNELGSAKMELESSKRHVLALSKKIKGLEIQYTNALEQLKQKSNP